MRGLLSSLILHDKVVTTEAKAKQLKQKVERLISRSKNLDLSARRKIRSLLPEKIAAEKLIERIAPQFKERIGGYVRVIKLPQRRGDNAPMARIEFVEKIAEAAPKKPTKQRKPAQKSAKVTRKVRVNPRSSRNAKKPRNKSKRS